MKKVFALCLLCLASEGIKDSSQGVLAQVGPALHRVPRADEVPGMCLEEEGAEEDVLGALYPAGNDSASLTGVTSPRSARPDLAGDV